MISIIVLGHWVSVPATCYFRHTGPEEEYKSVSFDWERAHAGNGSSDYCGAFSQPAWSFLATEDSQDSMSLLSEESCSSIAEREGRYYGFESHSVKLKESKITHRDKHHIGSDEKYVADKFFAGETMYTDLDEDLWEENYASMPNHWPSRAGFCSTDSFECPGMFESECISLPQGGYSSPKVSSAPTEADTKLFGCELVSEDNLFDMFHVPKVYSTADFTIKQSKLKIPGGYKSSKKFMFEDDIDLMESQFQKDAQFPDLPTTHKTRKENVDGHRTLGTPQKEDSMEKKSLSSVNSGTAVVADCKSNHSEHQESNGENQEQFDGRRNRDHPPYEAEEAPVAMEENHILDQCNDGSPVPSQITSKEPPVKENPKTGGGGGKDTSYQVMLESYVLQLLCVQKVLLDASEKDIKKR